MTRVIKAIDAIGYICFYQYQSNVFELLMDCYHFNKQHDLLRWKIFRAMSAVPGSEKLLKEQLKQMDTIQLKNEIERSISLIEMV